MLKEIKEFKIKQLQSQMPLIEENEAQIKELKEKIEKLENQIEGKNQLIPSKKFNWLQKHITQRKQYKEQQKYAEGIMKLYQKKMHIDDKIQTLEQQQQKNISTKSELESQIEEIKSKKTLQSIGMDFSQAIQFMEENNIPVVLSNEDINAKQEDPYGLEKHTIYKGIEDFVLVHKTQYAPMHSRIKSSKETKGLETQKITIDGKEYSYSYEKERNTVHFAVNGEVSSHAYGNWDNSKYAILIPFKDVPKEQIEEAPPVDTFTKGGVNLTENSWILCPKGEGEQIKQNNPNVKIMEYEGENVTGYGNRLVSAIGYKNEEVGMWSWSDKEANNRYLDIVKQQGLTTLNHTNTTYCEDEEMLESINRATSLFGTIKRNGLIKNKGDLFRIYTQLNNVKQNSPTISATLKIALGKNMMSVITGRRQRPDTVSLLAEKLSKEGINLTQEYQKVLNNLLDAPYSGEIDIANIISKDIDCTKLDPTIIEALKIEIEQYNKNWADSTELQIGEIASNFTQRAIFTEVERQSNREEKNIEQKNQESIEKE